MESPSAPQVVGTPTTYVGVTSASTTTIVPVVRPSGAMNGDYIIVFLRNQSSTIATEPTAPGFTRLGPDFVGSSSSFRVNGYYGHPITDISSEPATYDFSFTQGTGSGRVVVVAFIVRGVDLDAPISGFAPSYSGTAVTGGRQVDSYAITGTASLALFAGAAEFASPNDHIPLTYPDGYTEAVSIPTSTNLAVSRTYAWVGSKEVLTSSVDTVSMTWGSASSAVTEGIALLGAPVPDLSGDGYRVANGQGAETAMYYTTADGPRTPADVIPVRRGFTSVTEMLATPGVTWAHRGGSASYPEMSLYAYTQAVVRGYGVLEVSLARTSDGVWFGLHDQTTDRTSGGTFGNASAQTWTQIQAQQNTIGPGAAQPYMRWEELVAAYGSTHILVIDPKYTLGSYRTEFLNMVYNDIGPSRAIIKYTGPGSSAAALSATAQGMGFQTWGYFYASDASAGQGGDGNLQTWGPGWTLIGMEHGASATQAIWDEALALGKPVFGHIASNQTAYNSAMTKGASGVQVSGVAVVEPVSWWNALPKRANLIGGYGFYEGSGASVADLSGNGNTLTIGVNTTWTTGHTGGGIQSSDYNGLGGYNTSFTNPTDAITLMGWAYPRNLTLETPLFGFWSGTPDADPNGSSQFAVYATRTSFGPSGVLSACVRFNGTLNAVTGSALEINTWQHIALTYDGATVTLYLNGAVAQSTAIAGTLGVGAFVAGARADCIVDEVEVFNVALTQAEIIKWMNGTL